jgi:hypothetical protein
MRWLICGAAVCDPQADEILSAAITPANALHLVTNNLIAALVQVEPIRG